MEKKGVGQNILDLGLTLKLAKRATYFHLPAASCMIMVTIYKYSIKYSIPIQKHLKLCNKWPCSFVWFVRLLFDCLPIRIRYPSVLDSRSRCSSVLGTKGVNF